MLAVLPFFLLLRGSLSAREKKLQQFRRRIQIRIVFAFLVFIILKRYVFKHNWHVFVQFNLWAPLWDVAGGQTFSGANFPLHAFEWHSRVDPSLPNLFFSEIWSTWPYEWTNEPSDSVFHLRHMRNHMSLLPSEKTGFTTEKRIENRFTEYFLFVAFVTL